MHTWLPKCGFSFLLVPTSSLRSACPLPWCVPSRAVSIEIAHISFQKGKKTGMAKTDTVVDRIIRSTYHRSKFFSGLWLITVEVTIQTGVLTALFNVLDVVSFLSIKVCFISGPPYSSW
jgi:hypothetical protein